MIVIENRMIHVHRGRQLPDGLTSPDTYFLPGYGWASGIADNGESERLFERGVTLPSGSALLDDEIERVIKVFHTAVGVG